jgi:unsaturated rhamnogalacturonyl hydrolase
MKKETPGESVMWGADDYNATEDANGWLATLGRAGSQVLHEDNDSLVASVADRLIDLPFITWNFGDSVAFEALIAASERLGDEKWSRFAHGWGRAWASRAYPYARLDCTAPGHALVGLARRYGDERLLKACLDLGEYLTSRPTLDGVYETWEKSPLLLPYGGVALSDRGRRLLDDPPAGVFLDCLHFDPPFFAALGAATGDQRWIGEAVDQALGYVRLLQSPSGLFDHFVLRGESGSFGPGWGRGQGWAVLGLLDVIEILDEVGAREEGEWHDARTQLARALNLLIEAMLKLQRDDGHWYAVVDDPESGDEFSTSAFMVSAFARAMRLCLVGGSEVAASARRARAAVMRSLDSAGQLREVSAAVYASTESAHYGKVPRGFVVPWGQGPALLALVEREIND